MKRLAWGCVLSSLLLACGEPFTGTVAAGDAGLADAEAGSVTDAAPPADATPPPADGPRGDADSADEHDDSSAQDADGAGSSPCVTDLSDVGNADFHIRFTLTTTAGWVDMALLNQRTGCDETSAWWDVAYIQSSDGVHGALAASTCDGSSSNYVVLEQAAGPHPDDGTPHKIVVTRIAGQFAFTIDDLPAAGPTADSYAFASLPALKIGTDDCASFGPTTGSITDVCITKD